MASKSETSHEVNYNNFGRIIACAEAQGTKYAPSNTDLSVVNLKLVQTDMRTKLTAIYTELASWIPAVNDRVDLFKPLNKLIRRVVNSLKATKATASIIKDVETIARKLEGERATPKLVVVPKEPEKVTDKIIKQISSSQMSFDNRIGHFEELITLLGNITEYAPNEDDLKLTALTAMLSDMRDKNDAVTTAFLPVDNARIDRDDVMYTGKFKCGSLLCGKVKSYFKGTFGGRSPQYTQVCKYPFKNLAVKKG